MTTKETLKQVLLDALSMALNEPTTDDLRVNELCDRLDRISR